MDPFEKQMRSQIEIDQMRAKSPHRSALRGAAGWLFSKLFRLVRWALLLGAFGALLYGCGYLFSLGLQR